MKKREPEANGFATKLAARPRRLAPRSLPATPLKSRGKSAALHIRPGARRDASTIMALIRGLAKYERLLREYHPNAQRFRQHGFGRRRYFETLICTQAERPVGFALYYFTYSTFACRPILFIEDIFVLPDQRGQGAGKALMSALARIAIRKGCDQMAWNVLHWNTPAINFYRRLGARLDKTWLLTRLTDSHLRRLARAE
jgi:GNAT superfamily N-acetyltransferase